MWFVPLGVSEHFSDTQKLVGFAENNKNPNVRKYGSEHRNYV